jgi:hypothetical protein
MKLLAATTALAAVFACSPAFAQTPPPTPESQATSGSLKIEGVPPSKVLGAIDTTKLVDAQPADEAKAEAQASAEVEKPQEPLARTADSQGVTQVPDPNDKTHSDTQSAATGALGVQTAALPEEITEAISDGKYTTRDLVQAQLEAVQRMPVITPTQTGTITTTVTPGSTTTEVTTETPADETDEPVEGSDEVAPPA